MATRRKERATRYERVVLKVTGECFSSPRRMAYLGKETAKAAQCGCALAIVVGGGNLMRGRQTRWLGRVQADQAGMLATVMNGIALENLLERQGIRAAHLSALEIPGIVRRFSGQDGRQEFAAGSVLVLSGGTGNPLFSTDSAAVLRAAELDAQVILKGTKVMGIFTADPLQDPDARFLPELSYRYALRHNLQVMDATAFALGAEHRIPLVIFDFFKPGSLAGIVKGEQIGSRVC